MARILLLVPLVAIAAGLGYLANASGQGTVAIDETTFFPQKVLRVEYAPHRGTWCSCSRAYRSSFPLGAFLFSRTGPARWEPAP